MNDPEFGRAKNALSNVAAESEIEIWLAFLFELTIVGRGFAGCATELEQVNELNHRILNRIRDLRAGCKWSSLDDVFSMIALHVDTAPKIEHSVARALKTAMESA